MKTIFLLLLAALAFAATAQPQKIHYQGVAVGANGKPIKNSTVGLRLSVLDSLPTGTSLYTETQTASTDASGQFSIFLGGGTATAGTFTNLPWANGNDKFLKVEMDAQGGTNYQPMGTTQLVSVPYAMAAGSLREGALLYGNNGQQYQLTIDSTGPKWVAVPFSCGQSVTYAGRSYPTVQIGTQCWFSKNLNVGNMITSSSSADNQTNNGSLEKFCYNNNILYCDTFGGLYQWGEAVQYANGASNMTFPNPAFNGNVQGICPNGWHLPSYYTDWITLETYLSNASGPLKSNDPLWGSFSSGANNITGFNALPGGYRMSDGSFYAHRNLVSFWSSSDASSVSASFRGLGFSNISIGYGQDLKSVGLSIRCVKD